MQDRILHRTIIHNDNLKKKMFGEKRNNCFNKNIYVCIYIYRPEIHFEEPFGRLESVQSAFRCYPERFCDKLGISSPTHCCEKYEIKIEMLML